jgi:folate-dependent phosphoribosylglycinamide formyltransferase PurN
MPEDTETLLHSRIKDQEQQLLIETIRQVAEGSLDLNILK